MIQSETQFYSRTQDDVEGLTRRKIEQLNYLDARNFVEDLLDERLSLPEVSRLQTRQLGDIEFSNKYAEFLRTKAKLCSFLRGMHAPREDAEGVNQLLKQYMCPGGYQQNPAL
ncbi:hypothetical protein SKAU_G00347180 [Synaphobranchus kaupii]|uniref:Uncharacterized protein n=1 Tax=Synaphobranchus kaupii TaxID=118154 RepID=A0A9Q1EJR9_SYNKA|nr:hypothetical protein SKAU_G00347180 [Synaphobranchus kaupii]